MPLNPAQLIKMAGQAASEEAGGNLPKIRRVMATTEAAGAAPAVVATPVGAPGGPEAFALVRPPVMTYTARATPEVKALYPEVDRLMAAAGSDPNIAANTEYGYWNQNARANLASGAPVAGVLINTPRGPAFRPVLASDNRTDPLSAVHQAGAAGGLTPDESLAQVRQNLIEQLRQSGEARSSLEARLMAEDPAVWQPAVADVVGLQSRAAQLGHMQRRQGAAEILMAAQRDPRYMARESAAPAPAVVVTPSPAAAPAGGAPPAGPPSGPPGGAPPNDPAGHGGFWGWMNDKPFDKPVLKHVPNWGYLTAGGAGSALLAAALVGRGEEQPDRQAYQNQQALAHAYGVS
jgi:hypothetical protein